MPYIMEIVKAGDTIEISKYYSSRFNKKCKKRSKRVNITKEEQFKVNERAAAKKLRRSLNENFKPGDSHTVLTYRKNERPASNEAMREDINKFMRELRKIYKKHGAVLKYISVMEVGSKGARHHHIVMNMPECVPVKEIMKAWTKGRVHINLLDDYPNYAELADYLIKQSSHYFRMPDAMQKKRWCSSKNLRKPVVLYKDKIRDKGWYNRIEVIPKVIPKKLRRKFKDEYYIDSDMTREGVHEKTQYSFFSYMLIKNNTIKKGVNAY